MITDDDTTMSKKRKHSEITGTNRFSRGVTIVTLLLITAICGVVFLTLFPVLEGTWERVEARSVAAQFYRHVHDGEDAEAFALLDSKLQAAWETPAGMRKAIPVGTEWRSDEVYGYEETFTVTGMVVMLDGTRKGATVSVAYDPDRDNQYVITAIN